MHIYLVGGAVRDHLLGVPSKERDWVVVGSTVEEMLSQGFVKVGKDFPVFLHPKTHDEYALARTERKVGKGYYGFECYAAPDVTLEQDLQRRDLTINAIAATVDKKGHIVDLIDPYHGQDDIKNHVLRHVSEAFKEDPVRILRVARFSARFFGLGFEVAPETMTLMRDMVDLGEVDELVPERVWQEWQRSLTEPLPALFLDILNQCGALERLFPSLVNTVAESMVVLHDVSLATNDPDIRFAATLLHTPSAAEICQQYRVPGDYQELAVMVQEYGLHIIMTDQVEPEPILTLLGQLDAWRRPERFEKVLKACAAIWPEHQTGIDGLWKAYEITDAVKPTEFVEQGLKGVEIQKALQAKRLTALNTLRES